jgi:hypothetical protein
MPLILPNTIANEQFADGDKLQQNYATIEDWANQEAITRDGSTAMQQQLLLPGPPTETNQASTKGYVDSETANTKAYVDATTWAARIPIDTGSMTGGASDLPLVFGASPLTGIATVSVSVYVGFSQGAGQALVLAYTNAYSAPNGGGFLAQQAAWTPFATGGTWEATATVTLVLPVTKGAVPNCAARFRYTSPNLYASGNATIQALRGTW